MSFLLPSVLLGMLIDDPDKYTTRWERGQIGRGAFLRERATAARFEPRINSQEISMTPTKLYRIGEVIQYSGISRQTIHNYTLMGLIREADRTEAGHRLYGEDVFNRLEEIKRLKKTRTLKEIRLLLDGTQEQRTP